MPYHNTLEKMNNEVSRYVVFMSVLQLAFSFLENVFPPCALNLTPSLALASSTTTVETSNNNS